MPPKDVSPLQVVQIFEYLWDTTNTSCTTKPRGILPVVHNESLAKDIDWNCRSEVWRSVLEAHWKQRQWQGSTATKVGKLRIGLDQGFPPAVHWTIVLDEWGASKDEVWRCYVVSPLTSLTWTRQKRSICIWSHRKAVWWHPNPSTLTKSACMRMCFGRRIRR